MSLSLRLTTAQERPPLPSLMSLEERIWPFRKWFEDVLATSDLEHLHILFDVNTKNYVAQVLSFQRLCNANSDGLNDLLQEFLTKFWEPFFGTIAYRQHRPTFRAHFAVDPHWRQRHEEDFLHLESRHFLDKYYSTENTKRNIFHRDGDYHLPESAINIWIPVTDASGTNSLWLGGLGECGRDARPWSVKRCSVLAFHGATNWHGTVWNTTGCSRISFDLRVIPA